jgi:uncharacterized protein (TIGR03437 family)
MIRLITSIILFAVAACAQIANIVVTSAADYSVGLPTGGAAASLFCTGLDVQGTVAAAGAPLPYTLAGVQVSVGGSSAPLYAVASLGSYQQINFEVPAQVATQANSGTVAVVVTQGTGSGLAAVNLTAEPAGQFFQLPAAIAGGTNVGVFQRISDYSLITTSNPALAGDNLVAYITGLPYLQPLPPDGTAALANPLTVVTPPAGPDAGTTAFQLSFDGATPGVVPLFMGLSPGAVGLGQVNFKVPPLAPGLHQLGLDWIGCAFFNPLCFLQTSNTVELPVGQ